MSHRRHHAAAAELSRLSVPTTTTPASVMTNAKTRRLAPISEQEIRLSAYRKWESAGRPTCDGVQFWLAAKQELEQALASTTLKP
jgi:hypothetical protein